MYKGYNIVVFATEHYNTLGLIRSLGEMGISPDYISVKGRAQIASKSKYLKDKIYFTETIKDGYDVLIEKYLSLPNKTIVLCIEDKVVYYLDNHRDEWKDKIITFSAYDYGRIADYMNKYNILQYAKKCGLKVLDTILIDKNNIPNDIIYPIITKSESPATGGWKADVFICKNKNELEVACKKIVSDKVVIQKFINKINEYNIDGFSYNKGQNVVFTIGSNYNYNMIGFYSPYMHIMPINDNDDIIIKTKKLINSLHFDGIFDAEFLVDEDNTIYFSEVNFRMNGWSYSSTVAGMNLPKIWLDAMIDNKTPEDLPLQFEPFDSMIEPIDFAKRVDTGKITKEEWLADFKDAKCTYYYNKNDREPFYEMMRNFDKLK